MPSPAAIIATLALLVALGGSGYAISQLPRSSVGTTQLKANSVTSAKVRNGTLRAEDFRRGTLLSGPRGEVGPRGPAGTSTGGTQVVALSILQGAAERVALPGDWARPVVSDQGEGIHGVTFDRTITGCSAVATAGFDEATSTPRLAAIDRVDGNERMLLVRVSDAEGLPAEGADVSVMVTCPG